MSKKRSKKKFPKCHCCGIEKYKTDMQIAVSEMEQLDRVQFKEHYKELKIDSFDSFINSDFDWACDACLKDKKAIKANPSLQNYSGHPHLAFYDTTYNCSSCNNDFIFGKDEKKFWFESLKFWIGSAPDKCLDCRREIRQLKNENKVLSEILKKEEGEMSSNELEQVIAIYTKWQKIEKAKYYTSLLKKNINP